MYKSKLIHILKTFTPQEIRSLGFFIDSPSANVRSEVLNLWLYLRLQYPHFKEDELDRYKIFAVIWGSQTTFSMPKLRHLNSELVQWIEEFMIHNQLKNDPERRFMLLLDAYKEKDLHKYFEQTLKKENVLATAAEKYDMGNYRFRYVLQEKITDYEMERFNNMNFDYIKQILAYLDVFYIAQKLKFACETVNYQNVFKTTYEPLFWDDILAYMQKNVDNSSPLLQAYFIIWNTLTEAENEEHFQQLLTFLDTYSQRFSAQTLSEFYTYARNYCIKKINNGEQKYIANLFKLYQKGLETNTLMYKQRLSEWDYKNIVTIGMRLNEDIFVEKFIHQYKHFLMEESRDNAYTYNLAYFYFYQKQYDKTIALLQDVHFSDIYYHLETKTLLLKTYYELNESISLFALADTLKVYLFRTAKIPDYQKQIRNRFISFITKMMRIKLGGKNNASQLLQQLNKNKKVSDFTWLNDKINALMKKH